MRICIISDPNSFHSKRWAEALAMRGHDVHLVCGTPVEFKGVTVHATELYPFGNKGIARMVAGARNTTRARKLVLSLKPDVTHLLGLFPLLAPDLKNVVKSVPNLVVSPWGSDIVPKPGESESFKLAKIKSFLLDQAAVVTATGQYLADMTKKYTDKDIRLVHYGIDTDKFKPRPTKHAPLVIGFVKHLERIYGPNVLIRAFALVAEKSADIRLVMVGGGSMLKELQDLAAELKIADRVSFKGRVPNDSLPAELNAMDMFAMPSLTESFGVAALEASACGLPIVASNAGGIPEVVIDNMTGLLVAPGDHMALAEGLKKLLNDSKLRSELGNTGKKFVEEKFRWEESLSMMEKAYHDAGGK